MIIEATNKIGGKEYKFIIDERVEMEALHRAIVLTNPLDRCHSCGDVGFDNKHYTSNKDTEGNIYVNVKCSKCGARSKLGQYKAGGYFWKDYEKYDPNKKDE
jgi:hypothetical protein